MHTLKFKTNVNCNHCIAKITPALTENVKIYKWTVDIENPDKILLVECEDVTAADVKESLSKVGYNAELIEETNA